MRRARTTMNTRRSRQHRPHYNAPRLLQWIGMLLPLRCLAFCNSSDTAKQPHAETITSPGSQICRYYRNEAKKRNCNEQGCRGKASCDTTTKCPETCQGCGGNQTARGDPTTYSCPQHADGARQTPRGQLTSLWA